AIGNLTDIEASLAQPRALSLEVTSCDDGFVTRLRGIPRRSLDRGQGAGRDRDLRIRPVLARAFWVRARAPVSSLGETAVAIEHIGSTAVPGLAAKPVIDILVTVNAIEPDD